ncbi:MAG: EAL domain-containing protein [Pseudomonadota bacterium]
MQSTLSLLLSAALVLFGIFWMRHRRKSGTESAKFIDELSYSRMACLHASDGLLIMNMDGLIRWVNPAYCTLMGYDACEMIGKNPLTFAPLPEQRWDAQALEGFRLDAHFEQLSDRQVWQNMRKDGSVFWVEISMSLHTASSGTRYAVLVCRDVTRSIEREKELEATTRKLAHIAAHDDLTGLPNRAELSRFLNSALEDARVTAERVGLLHIDLDEFKQINDTHGHPAGDAVLQATANRLRTAIRKSDLVARVGGDEFVVVCRNLNTLRDLRDIGDALLRAVNQPVQWRSGTLNCQISIGAALSDNQTTDAEQLLIQSDFALYDVKHTGRGRVATYDAELHRRHARATDRQAALQAAIENKELTFYFQPVVAQAPGLVRGFETLVRWQHPTDGIITPDALIPLAQSLGLIAELDMLAMDAALELKARLNDWGHHDVLTSFNASSELLAHPEFCDRLLSGLSFRDLTADDVIVEVIESVVFEAHGAATPFVKTIADLDAAGIFTVLDDFGSGNAGIAQLAKLAIRGVKFDKSLGLGILNDPTIAIVYKTLVNLCNELDLRMVTEGIETPQQAARLRELGCTNMQGFLFAKPLPQGMVRDWLDDYTASAIAPRERPRYLKAN